MANRLFKQFFYSFTSNLVGIHGSIDIGASGAVTGHSIKGMASVAKTAAGTYTATLEDKYNSLESLQITFQAATAVDLVPQVVSSDVSGAKTIVFRLLSAAVPTDPATGTKVFLALRLRNSSVN